jgi:hypothetical protein
MAYDSDESGRTEVYVRPYPDVNKGRWQVSTGGGSKPLWNPMAGNCSTTMAVRPPER